MLKTFNFAIVLGIVLGACSRVGAPEIVSGPQILPAISHGFAFGYRKVFVFNGADGASPEASLLDLKGELYGTTAEGGNWSTYGGTVFVATTAGKQRVLHNFGQPGDGAEPFAGITALGGTLYGTTKAGGQYGYGTVFSLDGSGKEHVLHSFGAGTDGRNPEGGVTALNDTLYGTTFAGGTHGAGTVFSVSTSGKERVLHSFAAGSVTDGSAPAAGPTALRGTLYGTTLEGGKGSGGRGTVFSITTDGKERILHNFGNFGDGADPTANLIAVKGVLYGTTEDESVNYGAGTVFSITTSGKERVIYSFDAQADGTYPVGALIAVNGAFYGTTREGGTNNLGTVFSVDSTGHERVLHNFSNSSDGQNPLAGLTNVNGTLYGTVSKGGGNYRDVGTIFKIVP